jgi:hypothetical protein
MTAMQWHGYRSVIGDEPGFRPQLSLVADDYSHNPLDTIS